MWEAVETKTRKTGIAKTEERRGKRRSRKKERRKGRKTKEKKTKEGKDDGSEVSRSLMVDFILFSLFTLFYFSFLFLFLFLFLEQLGLRFISHAVTSVTN